MNYKYKKRQIFGKRLNVPKDILHKVYNCYLSFSEFIEYGLDDKIPTSCLAEEDRKIVDKFGLEAAKNLDWDLLKSRDPFHPQDYKERLMGFAADTKDLNRALYELIADEISPSSYSPRMREFYRERYIDTAEISDTRLKSLGDYFNRNILGLEEIIEGWEIFKDKDLSATLKHDKKNTNGITNEMLKDFMANYSPLLRLIPQVSDYYTFIGDLYKNPTEDTKKQFVKTYTDKLLEMAKPRKSQPPLIELSDKEFIEIFKYSDFADYISKKDEHYGGELAKELSTLPKDYIFNMPIPFRMLEREGVLIFAAIFGLKNIVDFDNECGHYFTNNNCEVLKLVYTMYLYFGGTEPNKEKTVFTKKTYDENGAYLDRPYTKEEFYETVRRMIVYGPNNIPYRDKIPSYKIITGEFREKNPDLFISDDAPEELQNLFYTKRLTPQTLKKHPEYIEFLKGKNITAYMEIKEMTAKIQENYEITKNFYEFLTSKFGLDSAMALVIDYDDILDVLWETDERKFNQSDSLEQIKNTLNECFRRLLIEKKIKYPNSIAEDFRRAYPNLFLEDDAPEKLKDALYNRTIDINFIRENPIYTNYLRGLDLELLYEYMPVKKIINAPYYQEENLIGIIKNAFQTEAFDVMLEYGDLLNSCFQIDKIKGAEVPKEATKGELLDILDDIILKRIIENNLMYSENSPGHFKNNNPTLFLSKDIDESIRNKFYNREFTLEDFSSNPNLLDVFGNTNIACGFPCDCAWIIPLFSDKENQKEANRDRLKIITAFGKIEDESLRSIFKENVLDFKDKIDLEKIDYLAEILRRLSITNSSEMSAFRSALTSEILATPNPMDTLNKIEDIFIKNNIPTIGKIYSCFEILHPNFSGFNIENSKTISPVLKKSSTLNRRIVVFADLVKCAFGSNNKSINDYLENIEKSTNLYERLIAGELNLANLKEDEIKELTTFLSHLRTLYNNTRKGKNDNTPYTSSGDLLKDLEDLKLKLSPDGTLNYNLADRIIKMFCGFAGINTLDSAKEYIRERIETADNRNRQAARQPMSLSKGDFIKGIGKIGYLRNILQNGSVAKEFLGSSAGSDNTPLDTDLSMIIDEKDTVDNTIKQTAATSYGPIWFVLKNDNRFMTTRTIEETKDAKIDLSKMETFYTGVLGDGHYGIRTGFASSEINYIIVEEPDPRVGLEIAMNGFYIPVVNKEGNIIFTPDDYDKLRAKMQGLSYFDLDTYTFSNNLVTNETEEIVSLIEQNAKDTEEKRDKINKAIRESLESLGLKLKTRIDGDLTEGYVELIDTGSTGRGTNKPGDGDFDFIMRLDNTILSNPTKLQALKQALLQALGKENTSELTGTGDFRLKSVEIDGITVDIDITFTKKTDKVSYSTDMAIQDRLTTIKKNDEEKYKYVIANILLAKQVLKSAGAYKPNRGEVPQGGLGGVGIENWILQNGGSFIDAALNFLEASKDKTFEEFTKTYQIWDFGENHLSEKRNQYIHDNFVTGNMSEAGYKKMTEALKTYIQKYQKSEELETKIL